MPFSKIHKKSSLAIFSIYISSLTNRVSWNPGVRPFWENPGNSIFTFFLYFLFTNMCIMQWIPFFMMQTLHVLIMHKFKKDHDYCRFLTCALYFNERSKAVSHKVTYHVEKLFQDHVFEEYNKDNCRFLDGISTNCIFDLTRRQKNQDRELLRRETRSVFQ